MPNIFSTIQPSTKTLEPAKPMPRIARILNTCLNAGLAFLAFALPIFICLSFTDIVGLGKQSLLLVVVSLLLVAWIAKALAEKSLTLTRHWMHLVVGLYGLGYFISAMLSQDRFLSLFGAPGKVTWSFATILALIVMYFIVVHQVRTTKAFYDLLLVYLSGSLLVAIFGLLQVTGLHLFGGALQNTNITMVGSAYDLATYLVVPLLLSAGLVFHGCRNKKCLLGSEGAFGVVARALVWLTGITSLVYLLLVDYWLVWAILLVGAITMVAVAFIRTKKVSSTIKLFVPGLLVAISILLLAFKVPIALNIASVVPQSGASFVIAKQALRDNALFGTGPGTWIYDYAKYRNEVVNLSAFWNIRFDRGYSTALTLLATTGIVGTALWLIVIISLLVKASVRLVQEKDDDTWYAYFVGFTAIIALVFTSFFSHLGMVHLFVFWLLLSLLTALAAKNTLNWDKNSTVMFGFLSIDFVVSVVIAISVLWLVGQRALAEARFTKAMALFRSNGNIEDVFLGISSARALNPFSDTYLRNLSQANLVKAARLIQSKPSAEDAAQIDLAIKTAVDLGIEATQLNPQNVDNWSNLALMYQSVASNVRGADEYAIKYYKEASDREPQNPVFLSEIGKLYLFRSNAYRTEIGSSDPTKKAEAEKGVQENLALAEDFLKKSITAKPDYLPARYQLGIVYERQNRLKDAIGELEKVLVLKNTDIGVAFELSILYYRDNRKDQSYDLLTRIVQRSPENVNARWYLAALQEERGLYEEALKTLATIQQEYPDNDTVKQRINAVSLAKAAQESPKTETLPEPIQETIQTQNP